MQGCAVKNDGQIVCWHDDYEVEGSPPSGSFTAVSVSSSFYLPYEEDMLYESACAVRADGDLVCWGFWGAPEQAELDGPFIDVAVLSGTAYALRADGTVVEWSPGDAPEPVPGTFTKIAANWKFHGLQSDGRIVVLDSSGIQNPPANETFVDVATGVDFACGLRTDGHVRCWGSLVR